MLVEEILQQPKYMFGRETQSLDEGRYVTMSRMQAAMGIEVLKPENLYVSPEKMFKCAHVLQTFDPSHFVKVTVGIPMVISVLQSLGTERHHELTAQVLDGEVKTFISQIMNRANLL